MTGLEDFSLVLGSDAAPKFAWDQIDTPRPMVCGFQRFSVLLGQFFHPGVGLIALIDQSTWALLSMEAISAAVDERDMVTELYVAPRNWLCLAEPQDDLNPDA